MVYTCGHHQQQEERRAMAKHKTGEFTTFGARLAELRKAAGFTQHELAAELGVSRGMIAYYESESEYPPTALLPKLALALGVSADALLGIAPVIKRRAGASEPLHRRLRQVEQLGRDAQRQVWRLVELLVERDRLKRQVHNT
jgi:transcriptional regulator with XRE-family HTH domain